MATRKRIYLKPYWAEIDKILKIMYCSSDAMSFEEVVYYSKMLDIIKYKLINLTEQNFTKSKALKECIDFIFEFQDVLYRIKQQKDPRKKLINIIEGNISFEEKLSYIFFAKKIGMLNFFLQEMYLTALLEELFCELNHSSQKYYSESISDMEKLTRTSELILN